MDQRLPTRRRWLSQALESAADLKASPLPPAPFRQVDKLIADRLIADRLIADMDDLFPKQIYL